MEGVESQSICKALRRIGQDRKKSDCQGKPNVLQYVMDRQASRMKYELSKLNYLHPRDPVSVFALAHMEKENVFLYKPQGLPTIFGNPSVDETPRANSLFAFGYQNARMGL